MKNAPLSYRGLSTVSRKQFKILIINWTPWSSHGVTAIVHIYSSLTLKKL
ncbi:hypothetical protein [Rickettsia sp.]